MNQPASSPPVTEIRSSPEPVDDLIVRRKHPGRWVSAFLVLACTLAVVSAFATSPNIHWDVVGDYLTYPTVLEGIKLTVILTAAAQLVGVVGGIALAIMARSENGVLRSVSAGYVWLFRGTPLLIQIIFWYNLALVFPRIELHLPGTGIGFSENTNDLLNPVVAGVIALGLNEAAYMAEIVRAGFISVDRGQADAAMSIGLTKWQTMRWVILPQAIKVIIPPTGNELINMLKGTSLVSVIAARELLTAAQQIYAINFMTVELLIVASIWYLAMSSLCSFGQRYLERRVGDDAVRVRQRSVWNKGAR